MSSLNSSRLQEATFTVLLKSVIITVDLSVDNSIPAEILEKATDAVIVFLEDINQTWQKMTGSEDDLAQSAVDIETIYDYMGNKSLVFGIHTAENPLTISFASISERISDDLYSRGIILDTGIFSQEALCYALSKELEENFNGYYLREEFFTEQLKEYREDFDRLTESTQDIVKNFAHLVLSELHLP